MENNYQNLVSIEKRNIRRHCNIIAFALLLNYPVSFILSMIISYVLSFISIVNGANFGIIVDEFNNSVFTKYAINTICSFILFVVVFLVLCKVFKVDANDISALKKPSNTKLSLYCMGLCWISINIASRANNLFQTFTENVFGVSPTQPTLTTQDSLSFSAFLFLLFSSAVVPALFEEFCFRGVIYGLLKKFGDIPAIIISSLLFSLIHGNFVQIPYTFIFGLALAFTRYASNSLIPCIIVHLVNNSLAVIAEYSGVLGNLIITAVIIALFIFGFFSVYKIISERHYVIKDVPSTMKKSKRLFTMITSPVMIVFIALSLISAFMYFTKV